MYVGYRATDGSYAMQQVNDGPIRVHLADIPARVKDGFGVVSVELMEQNLHGTTEQDRADFRQALSSQGVALGLLGLSRCAGDANPTHREEDLTVLEELIDLAGELGAEQVRVVLLPPPIVPLPDAAPLADLIAALERLSARAKSAGVRLMVENDDAITADPTKLVPILDGVGSDVGLVLDTGNIEPVMGEVVASFMEGREARDIDASETYETITALLPRAEVVHVKTYGYKEDGSSKVYDVTRVLRILTEGDFTGPVTVEYAGADGADADSAISRTIELIRAA